MASEWTFYRTIYNIDIEQVLMYRTLQNKGKAKVVERPAQDAVDIYLPKRKVVKNGTR